MTVIESKIEQRFRAKLRRLGCLVYKFVSPGNNGVPDRIVITPGGTVYFVELKKEDGALSPEQRVQLRRLQRCNVRTAVIHGIEEADLFIRKIEREVGGGAV